MLFPNEFSKAVKRFQRDESGAILKGPDDKPISQSDLGTFIFRVPTVQDKFAIDVQALALVSPITNPQLIRPLLYYNALVHATIPRQVKEAPKGWAWDQIYDEYAFWDLYEAYGEGLEEIRKAHPTMGL